MTDPDGTAIPGATVGLEGVGFRLTDNEGGFQFGAVESRAYSLRVEALGYAPTTRTVVVDREDLFVGVELEVAPIVLDSLVVASRSIDVEGRVWDPASGTPVPAAEILSDQADPTRTSWGGRFNLRAAEGTDIQLQVNAFRYLPLDTTVVVTDGAEHRFDLEADSLALRMIDVEIARLDDRVGGLRAVSMGPFNRDDLVRWSGASLADLLRAQFPVRGRRVRCIILDERDVGGPMLGPTLENTFANDVERLEFLFRGAMLRIYTREFMRTMLGSGIELRRPVYSDMARPPLCG